MRQIFVDTNAWIALNLKIASSLDQVTGIHLSKQDEFDLSNIFESQKVQALEVQQQIDRTDVEIDRMVYDLYGLTEEEIRIVGGNTS